MVRPIKPEFNLPTPQQVPAPVPIPDVAEITASRPRAVGDERVFAGIVTLVFLVAAIFNVWHHAMWRDEMRTWEIVRASPTLADLHSNLRFEGTPMLWYLILWVLTKFTANVFAEQLVHVVIAAGVVFVFCYAAPFARWVRVLFCFGYFPFFEYATISRSYSVVLLLLLIGVALVCAERARPIAIGVVATVLAQVSVWGAGFGVLLVFTGMVRWLVVERENKKVLWKGWAAAVGMVGVSCALAYLGMRPGPGAAVLGGLEPGRTFSDKMIMTIDAVWKGWVPLPKWVRPWWNTNVLDDHLAVALAGSAFLLVIAILSLLDRPVALMFFVLGVAGLLGFTFFEFVGTTRHCGQLFMVLIAACWIGQRSRKVRMPSGLLGKVVGWCDAHRGVLLGVLLAVNVVSGVGANVADNLLPFSASKATADYIRSHYAADLPIAGFDDWCVAPVGALLGRPIYSYQMEKECTFVSQDDAVRHKEDLGSLIDQTFSLSVKSDRDVLLLLSTRRTFHMPQMDIEYPAGTSGVPPILHIGLVKKFDDSTVEDETEALYLAHRRQ